MPRVSMAQWRTRVGRTFRRERTPLTTNSLGRTSRGASEVSARPYSQSSPTSQWYSLFRLCWLQHTCNFLCEHLCFPQFADWFSSTNSSSASAMLFASFAIVIPGIATQVWHLAIGSFIEGIVWATVNAGLYALMHIRNRLHVLHINACFSWSELSLHHVGIGGCAGNAGCTSGISNRCASCSHDRCSLRFDRRRRNWELRIELHIPYTSVLQCECVRCRKCVSGVRSRSRSRR